MHSAAVPSSAPAIAKLSGQTMGTTWSAKLVVAGPVDLHRLHGLLQKELDRVVRQMSTWEADSDLCRFNRAAAGTWHVLPDDFNQVMACALRVARESGGAFDPAVGAMVQTWGFGASGKQPAVPASASLDRACAQPRWSQLALRDQPAQLYQPGGAQLDLSAIAKGYAVDLLLKALHQQGISDALVEVGGELAGRGRKPDGTSWRVLVETDADEHSSLPPRVLSLDGVAVATSGDRWHHFERQGVRYSHTLDPRTGCPVTHAAAAVTIVSDSAMEADAWATALTVMGMDEGLKFAKSHAIAARFVVQSAAGTTEQMSDRFTALLAT